MSIKPVKCGYCSKSLTDDKCVCGGIYKDGSFRHPIKPTLRYTPNETSSHQLNKNTLEWESQN